MNSEKFIQYLRDAQLAPFGQIPNDYLMWQKPDGDIFMVGMQSGQHKQILIYDESSGEHPHCYHYSINPNVSHQKSGGGEYDPVEELVGKVSHYRFVGSWHDPDVLMESPRGFGKVAANGRFDLAKQNILAALQAPVMEY